MIEIRCKLCRRLAMKVSPDTTGTINTKCQRCGRTFEVTLPLKSTNDEGSPPVAQTAAVVHYGQLAAQH